MQLRQLPNLIDSLLYRLSGHFRQSFRHRLADNVTVSHNLRVGCIRHLENVIGTAQHRSESGGLVEKPAEVLSLLGERFIPLLNGVVVEQRLKTQALPPEAWRTMFLSKLILAPS